MENLLKAFVDIIMLLDVNIDNSLWFLIIVLVLLTDKDTKLAAFLLLVVQVAFGYHTWLFLIIMFLVIFTWYLSPNHFYRKKYKKEYNKKVRSIAKYLKDVYDMSDDDIDDIINNNYN